MLPEAFFFGRICHSLSFYACLAFVRVHGSVAAYRIKGETHVHLEVEQKLFVAEGTVNGGIIQENEKASESRSLAPKLFDIFRP